MTQQKLSYFFGDGLSEGDASMRNLLGGKGANLAEMDRLNIPIPPGFTITTDACQYYYAHNKTYPSHLKEQVLEHLAQLEKSLGSTFGDNNNPLLLSVRSGAAVSLPGMMDTILNLGINTNSVKGLIKQSGDARFAWDSYRRFIQMFGTVAMGISHDHFEQALDNFKKTHNIQDDSQLNAEQLEEIVKIYKESYKKIKKQDFPEDPQEQLWQSINAVFNSWNNDRAISYRKMNDIKDLKGTAINIQSMVFGNMGDDSATGVCFSRDPATGENVFYGEYLTNAQGEDIVAGIRTPQIISKSESQKWAKMNHIAEDLRLQKYISLEEAIPHAFKQIIDTKDQLEKHYKDMQDMEFSIQKGVLYFLQTRSGKRTPEASLRIACEMVKEGLITKKEAIKRINPETLDSLLHPVFDPDSTKKVIAHGLNASPGASSGQVVFDSESAVELKEQGIKTILVRIETSPEDIKGMDASEGILTAKGGATSHAAVVARGMGKCCVSGCSDLNIDYQNQCFHVGNILVKKGDKLSLDGSTGEVMLGSIKTIEAKLSEHFKTIMAWADEIRSLKIRTNADVPKDARIAREFGAEGIGLCRTEHMFFEEDRILKVRKMILSENKEEREKILCEILPIQQEDFYQLFQEMAGLPVTIRLLDPPLHEFLPQKKKEILELSEILGIDFKVLNHKLQSLHEFNPMLGHRGCRLGITYPEIYIMQTKAIIRSAIQFYKETKQEIVPEIMIPLVGNVKELSLLKPLIVDCIKEELDREKISLKYLIGTMIEVPRAAVTADEIAKEADFFSFGTNDLTQMGCGFSRDDSGRFLKEYIAKEVYEKDPFQVLDTQGIGELMKIAIEKGRKTRSSIKLGLCGEHGGDPLSIHFCAQIGLDYVSCSPFRVPIARLASAQACL